jgi:hypothetical protein
MKQLEIFVLLLLLAFITSSCDYLKSRRTYYIGVDTLLNANSEKLKTAFKDTAKVKPVTPSIAEQKQPAGFGYGSEKYYMIVGSFLNQELAEKYAEKIQQMGYHTQIIQSDNSYYRVSAESYTSFKQGVGQITEFREKIVPRAWLHVKR